MTERVVDLTLELTHGLQTWDMKPPATMLPAAREQHRTERAAGRSGETSAWSHRLQMPGGQFLSRQGGRWRQIRHRRGLAIVAPPRLRRAWAAVCHAPRPDRPAADMKKRRPIPGLGGHAG